MLKIQILRNNEVIEGKFEDMQAKLSTVWLDVTAPDRTELEKISSHIKIDSSEIEDFLNVTKRPILQDVGEFTAVVFHGPEIKGKKIIINPHLLLASKEQKDFITVHKEVSLAAERITGYATRRKVELFQKGSTFLLFALLAELTEQSFAVLARLNENIGKLEEQVLESHLSQSIMRQIFQIKKELIYFQRALAADREVVSEIEKAYGKFLDSEHLSEFRLLYSDLTQLIELAATYRDILISAIEVHLSAISNNLNVIMKKLTAWAAIILVPSLIAGIYGMNFVILPLARHPFGFWLMLGLMLVSVAGLYGYFKRRDWI